MAEEDPDLKAAQPAEASTVVSTVLKMQHLRYWLIGSWALALWPVVGLPVAAAWLILTLGAGAVRSWFERRIAQTVDKEFGWKFIAVALSTGVFWAAAPALAWIADHPFGRPLAVGFVICGYVLVITQFRHTPRRAILISSPYTVVSLSMGLSLWGTPEFAAYMAALPMLWLVLAANTIHGMVQHAQIRRFQEHQAHLIEQIGAAKDKADAANKAKSAFLGVISHELRTPMNGVLGAAQLLSATRLDATQKEYVSIVRNSGDSLLALLNDILDLTKIEADKMTLDSVEIDARELIGRVGGTWTARAQEKGVDYTVEIADEVPAVILGDPNRLSQIVHNLLSNAVKFTDHGAVRLIVGAERIGDLRARLRFDIVDTGPGIAREDLERLFQPFTQVDASSTRRFGGTGLGLAISRRLGQMMGGELSVTSEVGEGSTFSLSIEAEVRAWSRVKPEEEITAEVETGAPMRVLVVEDHPVNRMIIEAWLASAGHAAVSAENGALGLEACTLQAYDLILMDVNMPVMDGLTATRELRKTAGPNQDTPVVVLSASARNEDHEAGYAAGADAYLNKPIDFRALALLLNRLAGNGREALREVA